MTVEQFAAECDVPLNTAAGWLRGDVLPRAETLQRLSKKFDRSIDWLLSESGAVPERVAASRSNLQLSDELASVVIARAIEGADAPDEMRAALTFMIRARQLDLVELLVQLVRRDIERGAAWFAMGSVIDEARKRLTPQQFKRLAELHAESRPDDTALVQWDFQRDWTPVTPPPSRRRKKQ